LGGTERQIICNRCAQFKESDKVSLLANKTPFGVLDPLGTS
jgi:hypothetical protein